MRIRRRSSFRTNNIAAAQKKRTNKEEWAGRVLVTLMEGAGEKQILRDASICGKSLQWMASKSGVVLLPLMSSALWTNLTSRLSALNIGGNESAGIGRNQPRIDPLL
jgi:hypothetical protein